MKASLTVLIIVVGMLATTAHGSSDHLSIRFAHHIAFAPAEFRLTATVFRHAENRRLMVEIDSGSFYRSSAIQLDGEESPITNMIEWKGLPAGQYTVVVTLVGTKGVRCFIKETVLIIGDSLPARRVKS